MKRDPLRPQTEFEGDIASLSNAAGQPIRPGGETRGHDVPELLRLASPTFNTKASRDYSPSGPDPPLLARLSVGSHFKCAPRIARTKRASTRYIWAMDHAASPQVFLSRSQFEARLGLRPGGLAGATLPPPDAIIGPVNKDGSLPRGTIRGWLPETVDYWRRTRLGQGFRSDVRDRPVAVRPPRPRSSTTGRFLSQKGENPAAALEGT